MSHQSSALQLLKCLLKIADMLHTCCTYADLKRLGADVYPYPYDFIHHASMTFHSMSGESPGTGHCIGVPGGGQNAMFLLGAQMPR